MIQSMTGYGKADALFNGKKIHVEIRSLNSKNLDLSMRMPNLYKEKEMEMRTIIRDTLKRGKIEANIWIEQEDKVTSIINKAAIASYKNQVKEISSSLEIDEPLDFWGLISRLPEVTTATTAESLSEEEWTTVSGTLKLALDCLVDFRKQEGHALESKFADNLAKIRSLLEQLEIYEKGRVETIRTRIVEKLSQLKEIEYDKGRLEQEMIYYIEKLDINEEKQRLSNHLDYFNKTLANGEGQGKKLGFISQEMGREINTAGSKSNQADMQIVVVKMKDELEQIKEQVLNVL